MGLISIFKRPQDVAPDTDFPEIPTELCVYQPSDEFAEPHMDVPSVPAMVPQRTSEKGGKQ